ncbi:MAG: hypothetical protein PHD40_06220 [Syntrophomonadaceae bacterium]|nr:hypothetical protein [Syntrophomonadaceae bacterium]
MLNNSGLDIFISVSLKYVNLNAVRYEMEEDSLMLEFACNGSLALDAQNQFIEHINNALYLYHKLGNTKADNHKFVFQEVQDITLIRIMMNLHLTSAQEIDLIIQLTQEYFNDKMVLDNEKLDVGLDFTRQVKNNLLRLIKESRPLSFVAYRQQGRVLVFHH